MSPITTHVLDTSRGIPAQGVPVLLEFMAPDEQWKPLAKGKTDSNGRIMDLLGEGVKLARGQYRLIFETAAYFLPNPEEFFYPEVTVVFLVENTGEHYHVPLLLSPFGYSTYRGS